MSALGTLAAATSASGLLPWICVAALGGAGAIGTGGFWAGHHWAASSCDGEKLESQVKAKEHELAAVAKAQGTSDKLATIGINLDHDLVITRAHQKTIIEEVSRDVDAHPDLVACLVPAATQRLRDEQVRDSAGLAKGGPVQR